MCGISATYLTIKNAPALALDITLEQTDRGRDATGVAWIDKNNKLRIVKRSIAATQYDTIERKRLSKTAQIAISHNRSATCNLEEKSMDKEAHPFMSEDGTFTLLQNGAVGGADYLSRLLEIMGHKFSSGVDSEVLLHILETIMVNAKDREDAMNKFSEVVIGNVLVLFNDGDMYGYAGNSSFNIVQSGNNYFIASEMESVLKGVKDKLGDKATCFFSKGDTMMKIHKNNGLPELVLYGNWLTLPIKDGPFIYNKTVWCDYCNTAAKPCETYKGHDRCHDCYTKGITEMKKVVVIPAEQKNTSSRLENHNHIADHTSISFSICANCKLPYKMEEVIYCSDCNRYYCVWDFNKHSCNNPVPVISNVFEWIKEVANANKTWRDN